MSQLTIEVTDQNFQTEVLANSLPVIVDFWAPWCGPCRKMMPMMDSLMVEYHNRIKIVKINADASKKLIKNLKILGVPYLVFYHKGEILFSQNGIINRKELEGIFDSQIKKSEVRRLKSEERSMPLFEKK